MILQKLKFGKKFKKKAEKKIEQKAEEQQEEQDQKQEEKELPNSDNKKPETNTTNASEQKSPEIWRNYKFIPCENVIFYDDLKYEEVGEFPSRWDLAKGGAEVVSFNGEKVIMGTAKYHNRILPLFDTKNYLGDEFTIEFDVYVDNFEKKHIQWANYNIIFDSKKLNSSSGIDTKITFALGKTDGWVSNNNLKVEEVDLGQLNTWHHIAMSYYKGKFKLYYDETRIANIPRFDIVPDIFALDFSSINASKQPETKVAIKNIRIAKGGGQMYQRIVADGKYITNGILFDSGKATIKPQSMGIINKVATVMNENPDWKFLIIGHTDSDGTEEGNFTLSKTRAEAVKQSLITLDIKADRLLTEGKGESQPINQNTTPEEKANNRRVEFIKQ